MYFGILLHFSCSTSDRSGVPGVGFGRRVSCEGIGCATKLTALKWASLAHQLMPLIGITMGRMIGGITTGRIFVKFGKGWVYVVAGLIAASYLWILYT